MGYTGGKNPNFIIEGRIFDQLTPQTISPSSAAQTVFERIQGKVLGGQTQRIILNLSLVKVSWYDVLGWLEDKPIAGLEEIIVIREGEIIEIWSP